MADGIRDAWCENHRALLIRRTLGELTELIDKSRQLFPKAYPGARFIESTKTWKFPSGATFLFGYCDTDQDVTRYIGQAYNWIGVDELTHFATPYVWEMLTSRCRTTDTRLTPYMRATTNPGGIGGWWVKKMFVDPAPWNTAFWATDLETGEIKTFPDNEFVDEDLRGKPLFKRRFIPAKLTDNPYLTRSPEYMASLSSMNEVQRRRLLEGDWDVAEDTAFPEFDKKVHVIDTLQINGEEVEAIPENIPHHWRRIRSCDYGFVAGTAVLWFAIDPAGTVYIYREMYVKGLDAKELGDAIIEAEWNEPPSIKGVLDHDSFARKGGPTNAEIMNRMGLKWVPADKGPGSRVNGKNTVHRLLKINQLTKKPYVQIFSSCVNLARIMPVLPLEKDKSTGMPKEDVDTNYPEDHLYDALRYGLNSRDVKPTELPQERKWRQRASSWRPVDKIFGY